MADASAESDKDRGPAPINQGDKLASLLDLAMHLPRSYSDELEYPPFPGRRLR